MCLPREPQCLPSRISDVIPFKNCITHECAHNLFVSYPKSETEDTDYINCIALSGPSFLIPPKITQS